MSYTHRFMHPIVRSPGVLLRGLVFALAGCLGGAWSASADMITWNNGFANGGAIPDGNLTGWSDTRTVNTVGTSLSDVSVTLNLSGGWNGDLYAYLVHDTGFAVLLNRVGRGTGEPAGYADAGMNLTLAASGSDIHQYQSGSYTLSAGQLTGTWSPDGRDISPLSSAAVFDAASRTALLGSFSGLNPNGQWTLFVADVSSGEQSTVQSWGLEIASVPEPGSVVEAGVAALFLGGMIAAYRLKGRRGGQPGGAA